MGETIPKHHKQIKVKQAMKYFLGYIFGKIILLLR